MELKDFISGTIKHIIDGTNEAIDYGEKHNAKVSPGMIFNIQNLKNVTVDDYLQNVVNIIDFDVAVSSTEGGEVSSQVGIFVVPLFGGVKATGDKSSSVINRIQFSIPILLPKSNIDR